MDAVEHIRSMTSNNLARVDNLVRLFENELRGDGAGRRPVSSTDILRSAVVFLHATLEDFLRNLAETRVSFFEQDALNAVPLVGQKGRAEKFYLGDLVKHKNKTVKRVFKESLEKQLEKTNYNNIQDLKKLLVQCGIRPGAVSAHFEDIGKMMARRHHIVHRVDKNSKRGRGHHVAKAINTRDVVKWRSAVSEFVEGVLQEIS